MKNNGNDKGKGKDVVKERAGKWLWKWLPCILSVLLVMLEWISDTIWSTGVIRNKLVKPSTECNTYIHAYLHAYIPLPTYVHTYIVNCSGANPTQFVSELPRTSMKVLKLPRLPHKSSLRCWKRHACHAKSRGATGVPLRRRASADIYNSH